MVSFSWFTAALACLTAASFGLFAWYSVQLHMAKPSELAWRGIIKMISLGGVPPKLVQIYPRWFTMLIAFFVSGCLLAANLAWATDHSFFVVIFPLLFYYFFARYFFWEKADLAD